MALSDVQLALRRGIVPDPYKERFTYSKYTDGDGQKTDPAGHYF